jgi:hypothetical protein
MTSPESTRDEIRKLPFWLVNVPVDQWPADCPEFLIGLDEKDRRIIGTPDSDYKRQTWEDCMRIIRKSGDRYLFYRNSRSHILRMIGALIVPGSNRIGDFHRVPSDLRRYRQYTDKLKREYGSILNFILSERLRWIDLKPTGPPFSTPGEF